MRLRCSGGRIKALFRLHRPIGSPASRQMAIMVTLVLAVGIVLRLLRLGEVPPGFHPDEAHNALDALSIRSGWRPAYLPGNNGREPLFAYAMAGLFWLLGPSIWSARLTAALAGTLVILAQVGLVAVLPLPAPRSTALLSGAILAVTFWAVAQSRYAIEAVALPIFLALTLATWWRLVESEAEPADHRTRLLWWSLLTAVGLATAIYAHLIGRLMVLVLAGHALWIAWRRRRPRLLVWFAATLACSALLLGPLIATFVRHPDWFVHRARIVSLLYREERPRAALMDNLVRLIGAANVRGDSSWSHNLRHRPVFDPAIGVFFLVGAGLLLRDLSGRRGRHAQDAACLLALAGGIMVLPSLLSIGAPNYTRLVGTWPVLFLLPAWGLERFSARVPLRQRGFGGIVAVAVVAVSGVWTAMDYFVRYAAEPRVASAFLAPVAERGELVARLARQGPAYAMPALWRQSVIRFLAFGTGLRSFDGQEGLVIPCSSIDRAAESEAPLVRYLCDPAETSLCEHVARRERGLGMRLRHGERPQGELLLTWLELGAASAPLCSPEPQESPIGRFGNAIELWSLDLSADPPAGRRNGTPILGQGARLSIRLSWRAIRPTEIDQNFFVHLLDATGGTVGQFDGPPLGGSYPTNTWLSGDLVIQRVELRLAEQTVEGQIWLRTGFYDWRTLERLPLPGSPENAVVMPAAWFLSGAN